MKVVALLLVLVAAVSSAPQPKQDLRGHFEDFVSLIIDEHGDEINQILQQYLDLEEITATIEYIKTNLKDLILEIQAAPEFQAVVDFLENNNIDISFFLDGLNDVFNAIQRSRGNTRQLSGTDFSALIQDFIDIFPREELATLFDQKMTEVEEFRVAIENLSSDEWNNVFTALWESPELQEVVGILEENGIVVQDLLDEVVAIFGQNK